MNKIRVLQIGCGSITNAWFPAAQANDDMEYVGLCDLNPEAGRAQIEKFGLDPELPVFSDAREALQQLQPDAVFDCTIPLAHTPNAVLAFEHGAHVLSEKPLSDSLENARVAVEAARQSGKIYAITQNYRYSSGPRRLKAFLDEKRFGKVTQINADMYLGAHFGGFRDQMKHVLLLDMAIHTFDMARFLSGQTATSVFCHEFNPSGSWYAHDASAQAIFEMTDDVVFNFRGSWCATGLPTGFGSGWRIIGERGTILWDGGQGFQCEIENGDEGFFRPVEQVEVPDVAESHKTQNHSGLIREFLDAIRGGEAPETRAEDNFGSFEMVERAVESSEKKARIQF